MSSPYYPPTGYLPPERRGRACWWLGCGILAFVALAGLRVCGGCFYLNKQIMGKPVAAADAWFGAAKSENWAAAGAVTQGGESRARTLGAEVRRRVGTIQAFRATVLGGSSTINIENAGGHAEITYSIRGDRGSTACTVVLDGPSDDWRVSDIRFDGRASPPAESEGTAPGRLPEKPEDRGSYET